MYKLLKPSVVFFCLGLLFPLSFTPAKYQPPSERLRELLVQQITDAEDALSRLEPSTDNDRFFYTFRRKFKTLEWTFPIFFDAEAIERITNSKFWVFQQQDTGFSFEETGNLQIAEADENYSLLQSHGGEFLADLKEKVSTIEITLPEAISAVLNDVYQQYFLHLTGYDLINTDQLLEEYQLMLKNYVQLLQVLDHSVTSDQKRQIKRIVRLLDHASKFTKQHSFESLDRASLFKKYLVPLQRNLQLLAASFQVPTPEWAKHVNSSVSPFSEDWLQPAAFIKDTTAYPKDSLVALGALLFVEPMLSGNNKRACISCHKPSKAFTDGRQTSLGFDFSAKLSRNAPSLVNTVYSQRFGHDLTFNSLEEQIMSVIDHHQEFRTSMPEIVAKLSTSEQYKTKFQHCFEGSSAIDSIQVLTALSRYMASLVFLNSPFDQYMRGEADHIEPAVVRGYNLFMGKAACGSCHFAPLFSGLKPMTYQVQEYQSGYYHRLKNGHPEDAGIANSSLKKRKKDADQYAFYFKTPTVRNLEYTIPYLHDGVWMSLDSLWADHYSVMPVNKRSTLKTIASDNKLLSESERQAILSFLSSLNEESTFPDPELLELPLTDGTKAPVRRRAGGIY